MQAWLESTREELFKGLHFKSSLTTLEVTDSNLSSSLLQRKIYYDCKKSCSAAPGKKNFFSLKKLNLCSKRFGITLKGCSHTQCNFCKRFHCNWILFLTRDENTREFKGLFTRSAFSASDLT
jgi:hypothetical protein